METLATVYEYARVLLYLLSGMSFYFCFNLLYIAGVSRQLELNHSKDYQLRYLESTNLSTKNISFIWRKINNFGLLGTFLLFFTFNFTLFIPIGIVLFSIYYISAYNADLIAKNYSTELLQKILNKETYINKYNEITPQTNI